MCPVWLLVAAGMLVGVASGTVSQCWEHPSCLEVESESSMMECIQLCRAAGVVERPLVHLEAPPLDPAPPLFLLPSPSSSSSSPSVAKRSYSMEHFRWGKPVGRKRRPIKVYTSNGVEEESADAFPRETMRRELVGDEKERSQEVSEEEQLSNGAHEKKDGAYKMTHFRWNSPPASKRYGGFMRSWDEQSQRPLLTLFKNVINKDEQQK